MKIEFNNFKEYSEWISENWGRTYECTRYIIDNNLCVERTVNLNGEPYRPLTEPEFLELQERTKILYK